MPNLISSRATLTTAEEAQENILYFADLAGFLIHSFEQVFGIDRVDEVEVFDGMLGLIGLQMTD